MKKRAVKISKTDKTISLVGFILFVLAVVFVVSIMTKEADCKFDQTCFKALEAQCKKARLDLNKEGNLFEYKILGKKAEDCVFTIKLEKVSPNSGADVKESLEGKEMTCMVPLNQVGSVNILENKEVIKYCTGPLKESILELMLERIYAVIAKNIGPIVKEIEDTVNKTI